MAIRGANLQVLNFKILEKSVEMPVKAFERYFDYPLNLRQADDSYLTTRPETFIIEILQAFKNRLCFEKRLTNAHRNVFQ